MRRIIFYSWQSDLPNATNRALIQRALEKAAAAIAGDDTVDVEPVIDRDTQGVAGAPDIASTIFGKITAADMFVADVSITSRPDKGRPTPNPNVLIELGYALKALGFERIALVFNLAYGKLEELPFDLRMRRIVTYNMPEEDKDRAAQRVELEKRFDEAIRAALPHIEASAAPTVIAAVDAIEHNRSNRIVTLRRNLDDIFKRLISLEPPKASDGGSAESLINGIATTQEVVAEFSKIAEMIAALADEDAALEVHRWFGPIFERYNLPPEFSGQYSQADFDYYKFLGHELFVTTIGFLIREQRWDLLGRVLDESIPLRHRRDRGGPGVVSWTYASDVLLFLHDENRKRGRMSVHADILNARHTTGGLAAILPMADFVAADFFLFLRTELPPLEDGPYFEWHPWSVIYLRHAPMFLVNSERTTIAERVARALGLRTIQELRTRLLPRAVQLRQFLRGGIWTFPIRQEDVDRIATR